uniref:Uncharacterized protein n=1 Tax=Trypanosoma congolense (strain IL3000) TaxID=1068625 RepID=G0UR80_TRYCI|nr:hypothetical protein, unlikely [Trypanosoma congolense IL3000]
MERSHTLFFNKNKEKEIQCVLSLPLPNKTKKNDSFPPLVCSPSEEEQKSSQLGLRSQHFSHPPRGHLNKLHDDGPLFFFSSEKRRGKEKKESKRISRRFGLRQ